MARVMLNSFLSFHSVIKIDHVAGSIQNTVDCEYYTHHLLRVEYPRNHQLKRAIYPIRYSKEL